MEDFNKSQTDILKEIEFYSAATSAWFATRIEKDKSLLFLSAGAISLIFGFLVSQKFLTEKILLLSEFSLGFFVICLFTVLFVLTYNADYLEFIIKNDSRRTRLEKRLKFLDIMTNYLFTFGVILSATTIAIYCYSQHTSNQFNQSVSLINSGYETNNSISPANPSKLVSIPNQMLTSTPANANAKNNKQKNNLTKPLKPSKD
jgi:hypothetical protein